MKNKTEICKVCHGEGERIVRKGNMDVRLTCFACHGKGKVPTETLFDEIRQVLNMTILI